METDSTPTQPAQSDAGSSKSRFKKVLNSCAKTIADRIFFWRKNQGVFGFKELYLTESRKLGGNLSQDPKVVTGVAGEPWVAFTPLDRFGLALSGGGIRSATFNLGFAQALAHLGVLDQVEYLSTVSGGGYLGGFWMAWLKRKGSKSESFPLGDDTAEGERAEVRHLREFSRFLLPRIGLMETEFWGIVMTVLGGLVPSLLAAIAVLAICWSAWVTITALILQHHPVGAISLGLALVAYLLISECLWSFTGKSECNRYARWGYVCGSLLGASMVTLAVWFWPKIFFMLPSTFGSFINPSERFFAPAMLLSAETLVLLFIRVVLARFFQRQQLVSVLEGFERALTRFLGLSVCLFLLAALWWIAENVGASWRLPTVAGGAVGSAALFAWAKKWLLSPVQETHGSNLIQTAIKHLKRATPKMLASVAWLLLFVLVAAGMHYFGISPDRGDFSNRNYWLVVSAATTIVILTTWLFDPARVGMHEFYRSRISRCYLGASNTERAGPEFERASKNRYVVERPGDDLTLKELSDVDKPIHLICTAANDIAGDSLGTLYRGARSAVLSANGISLGDQNGKLDDLRLSSALTASAAAFNSHMGRLSVDLGPAVTFLMSALNLRLGLWVPHPKNRHRRYYRLPGRFFLCELLGQSRANARNLHLSDGNHFENFGLYELIRRHVRYIIVSDCGADPEIAFDDLANVLRRVREDFGVEIELDVNALRPGATGLSKQHAVVGTIHYNGITGMDKGTILFFKPTITGDEPPDILQYRTRNRAFPHESTSNQFYDEPQWESYRRLGEHAARMVLGVCEPPAFKDVSGVDKLFLNARSRWHPAPERQEESFLEMTERCARLEGDLLEDGPPHLRAEIFSEVTELAGVRLKKPKPEEEMAIMSFLLRVTQIMEDVWLSADLDHYWSHPLNEGWMNYFHRWASTGSFRRWWPILAPIYSLGFREFAKERFSVGVQDKLARQGKERSITSAQLTLSIVTNQKKFMTSHTWQTFQQSYSVNHVPPGAVLFRYDLELLTYAGELGKKQLPVGLAIVDEKQARTDWLAHWRANDLFVPRAFYGSGILARFLDALVKHYQSAVSSPVSPRKFAQLQVVFAPAYAAGFRGAAPTKPKVLSQAARQQRVQDIEFYKSRGFQYVEPENPQTGKITLTLTL